MRYVFLNIKSIKSLFLIVHSTKHAIGSNNSDELPTSSELSANSLLSSSLLPNFGDRCADFLLGIEIRTTAASVVRFSPNNKNLYVVNLKKEENELSNVNEIISKLSANIGKQDVFKKRSTKYNESNYGKLRLSVTYGHIYFTAQDSYPQKLGELAGLLKEDYHKLVCFSIANINELNVSNVSLNLILFV